jgi:uncharacterized protein DUF664
LPGPGWRVSLGGPPHDAAQLFGKEARCPSSWDERTILTTLLDYARDTVHAKCAGLQDAGARRAPLPGSPLMTISGVVSHLRWVESSWIEATLLDRTIDTPWTDDDPDREFRIALEMPLSQLLAEYRAVCARHRDLVASLDLEWSACHASRGRTIAKAGRASWWSGEDWIQGGA